MTNETTQLIKKMRDIIAAIAMLDIPPMIDEEAVMVIRDADKWLGQHGDEK